MQASNKPLLAQHEAGRLGTAQVFATAEDGGVGAHLGELPQVFDRGKLGGGVHEHGHTVRVGDVDHSVQWEVVGAAHIALEPDDGGGVGVDGRFQLPVECTVGVADLHQLDADLADGVVVAVAVRFVDDYLVFEAGEVRQTVDGIHVGAGDAGGNGDDDSPGRARTDVAGLILREECDTVADAPLQFRQVNEKLGRLHHCLQHFGRH